MTKKFIITNRSSGKESERVVRSAIGFMEPYLQVAASKAGYEVFCLSYNSLRSYEHGNHYCQVAQAVFGNIDLLEIILMDQSIIDRITAISERKSGKKHDPKNNPLTVFRLNDLLQDPEFLELMQKLAAEHQVSFDKDVKFIAEQNRKEVNLEEFCAEGGENVVYLRYAHKGQNLDKFKRLSASNAVRFPVALASFEFNDKNIVIESPQLVRYSTVTEVLKVDPQEEVFISKIIAFYNKHCATEGLVIKPENGGAGNGIVFLEHGYRLDEESQLTLRTRIIEELAKSREEYSRRYLRECDSMILQRKVYSLATDETKLPTGDVRVTIINGEVVGYALRYSEKEGALSYALAKNILPDHKDFTPENIKYFIENSASETEKQYYV